MQVYISESEQAPCHCCHWEVKMCRIVRVQYQSESASMFTPALCDKLLEIYMVSKWYTYVPESLLGIVSIHVFW